MNIFKCFSIILISIFCVSTAFAADGEDLWQRSARPVQDWRKQTLTPEIARDLARHRAEMKSSQHKIINITEHDIVNSNEMLESVTQSISRGAYINAVDKHGNTTLHYICAAQNTMLALEFMEWGAKLLPNNKGLYPQDYISNTGVEWSFGCNKKKNCTEQEIGIVRNILIKKERKYSAPFFEKNSRNKQKGK